MDEVIVSDFWPFDLAGKRVFRTFKYLSLDKSSPSLTSVFYHDFNRDCLAYSDYDDSMSWKDTWYLRNDQNLGVVEFEDIVRQDNKILRFLFGPSSDTVYSRPILWGNRVHLGDVLIEDVKINPWKSHPPTLGSALQVVIFEELLPEFKSATETWENVLVFSYLQRWGSRVYACRYWAAIGVGPVALQWLVVSSAAVDSVIAGNSLSVSAQSTRLDAIVTEFSPS